jgi:hypothetical protein
MSSNVLFGKQCFIFGRFLGVVIRSGVAWSRFRNESGSREHHLVIVEAAEKHR